MFNLQMRLQLAIDINSDDEIEIKQQHVYIDVNT